jgi:hypothetical protein
LLTGDAPDALGCDNSSVVCCDALLSSYPLPPKPPRSSSSSTRPMPLLHPPAPDLRPSERTYTDAYHSIVSRVRRSGGSGSGGVVIFCGVDVVSGSGAWPRCCVRVHLTRIQDGLLGARILASLFKQDDVPYRLVPVGGYSELEAKRDEAFASEEVGRSSRSLRRFVSLIIDASCTRSSSYLSDRCSRYHPTLLSQRGVTCISSTRIGPGICRTYLGWTSMWTQTRKEAGKDGYGCGAMATRHRWTA